MKIIKYYILLLSLCITTGCKDARNNEELITDIEVAIKNKEFHSAYKDAKKLMTRLPEYSDSHLYIGIINTKNNKYQEAFLNFKESLQIQPSNFKAYTERARLKAILEDYKGAIDDCNKAEEYNPNYLEISILKANIYENMNEFSKAIYQYEKAIENGDDSGKSYYHLGMLNIKVGNQNKGCNYLRMAGERGYMKAFDQIKNSCNSLGNSSFTISEKRNFTQFGDIDICLPEIEGMKECYKNQKVKPWVDNFVPEFNMVIGYYLNNKILNEWDSHNNYDDYFQLYSPKRLIGLKAGQKEVNEMAKLMENNYINSRWKDINTAVKQLCDEANLDQPVMIDSYTPTTYVKSYVLLSKAIIGEEESIKIAITNLVNIKNRIIWVAYYKNYTDNNSVEKAKAKNDYFIHKLLDINS